MTVPQEHRTAAIASLAITAKHTVHHPIPRDPMNLMEMATIEAETRTTKTYTAKPIREPGRSGFQHNRTVPESRCPS